MNLDIISKPTLVVDEARCRSNIAFMAEKARRLGLTLRPHFKTHQSHAIGEWFRDEGITRITVSSVEMALYFNRKKWKDTTLAIPVNPREAAIFFALNRMVSLNLVVTDPVSLDPILPFLTEHIPGVFIKVDCGYGRAGLKAEDTGAIVKVAQALTLIPKVAFKGILTHDGHAYYARTQQEIEDIRTSTNLKLANVKAALEEAGFPAFVSAGDTPTCSRSDNWYGVDEIRPGNFVFYDVQQWVAGNCAPGQLATAVYCPVISVTPGEGKALLYGGSIHFSKDSAIEDGKIIYGAGFPVLEDEAPWPEKSGDIPFRLTGLSQEHGVITGSPEAIGQLKPGHLVAVHPAHSCLTMRQFNRFFTLDGSEEQTMNS
ncbi:MAG TPA: alanine racemase [Bacteroidales bacterium]|nr:MAG: hypothetical protein A2X11_05025 [Bacteroidetes bacterium GWE2_42_24]OFY30705.1 MAG: hypothetical protein A2X09_14535 [Bacteroidetes bacterium GWF2_43_11]HAQ65387.1 alanine racemase [Bacteroidales bacterium]HBZ65700.1 alanine racemase [Bacteroidales bacterium]